MGYMAKERVKTSRSRKTAIVLYTMTLRNGRDIYREVDKGHNT
jgi:hypothetical protein